MLRPTQVWPLLAPAVLGMTVLASAAQTDWRDIESRVQYAWYTEDARELAAVENRVMDLPDADPQRGYYLTVIQMREAQASAAAEGIERAASRCIGSADAALALRPTDAELLAVQSLCMDLRSRIRSVDLPFAGSRARAQMQRAVELAPNDPRVRLLAAQLAYASAKTVRERGQQVAPFQKAVDAFELERQGLERTPAWGGAEAWEGLARAYLDRGDAIAARSALEQALLLVPDYKSAHRLLNHILTG
jgi:tetratricopeptide (TPR) repeat protein